MILTGLEKSIPVSHLNLLENAQIARNQAVFAASVADSFVNGAALGTILHPRVYVDGCRKCRRFATHKRRTLITTCTQILRVNHLSDTIVN